MLWMSSRSGLWMILPSLRKLSPEMDSIGRSSQTSLHVKSNSLRPTQSIAEEAFSVSVGKTAVCAPMNPIFVSGRWALMASATLQSFFSDGVDVLMMTWLKSLAMRRVSWIPMLWGGQSSRREFGTRAAGWANQVGYQKEVTSRRAW